MTEEYEKFLNLSDNARNDLFEKAGYRLKIDPRNVEKDFWVCFALETLFNNLPEGHPRILFKGGTSLSKVHGLINRFSEDVDLAINPEDLGFVGTENPTTADGLGYWERKQLFKDMKEEESRYLGGKLMTDLNNALKECRGAIFKEDDRRKRFLLLQYPSLYEHGDDAYVQPHVKLEVRAKPRMAQYVSGNVVPYVSTVIEGNLNLRVRNIDTVKAERTYLDKLLALHMNNQKRNFNPNRNRRFSRHYYDLAMITETGVGKNALADNALFMEALENEKRGYDASWKNLEEAVPGNMRLVPKEELLPAIEADYEEMRQMMIGERPDFNWILERIKFAETEFNKLGRGENATAMRREAGGTTRALPKRKSLSSITVDDVLAAGVPDDVAPKFRESVLEDVETVLEIPKWWRILNQPSPKIADADRDFVMKAIGMLPDKPWDGTTWSEWTSEVAYQTGRRARSLFEPLRLALTGEKHVLGMARMLPLLRWDPKTELLHPEGNRRAKGGSTPSSGTEYVPGRARDGGYER